MLMIPLVKSRRTLTFLLLPSVGWLLLVILSLLWNLRKQGEHTRENLFDRSSALVEIIKDFRLWNARHGGVYVPVSPRTLPNPYLHDPSRDVTTTSGQLLTKVNPAYMTRQAADIANEEWGVLYHITSLKPFRPGNSPDPWERAALIEFEHGSRQKGELVALGPGEYFRYMIPLETEEECLRCHASQGYRKGDIRGGLSVSFPAVAVLRTEARQKDQIVLQHLSAFAVGFLIIFTVFQMARRAEKSLRENERKFKALFEQASESIFLLTPGDGAAPVILDLNSAACAAHGYTRSELLGQPITILDDAETAKNAEERRALLLAGESLRFQGNHRRKDGSIFPVEVSAQMIQIKDKPFVLAIDRDISERKQMEELLLQHSLQDGLTGVANRRHFDAQLEKRWKMAMRESTSLAVIMIDIDLFKAYNDSYGHQAGDESLKLVGAALAELARRAGDLLARYGGEEFVAILSSADLAGAAAVAEGMRLAVANLGIPHATGRCLTISAGVAALVPQPSVAPGDLVASADRALYRAKAAGRNRVELAPTPQPGDPATSSLS